MISEFAVLACIQFLLYASDGAAPGYFVGSLRLEHACGSILLRLPRIYNVTEKLCIDPVLVALTFYRVAVIDWFSSAGFDDFIYCEFIAGTV